MALGGRRRAHRIYSPPKRPREHRARASRCALRTGPGAARGGRGVCALDPHRGARVSCDIDSEKARALTLSQLPLDHLGSLEQSLPREGIFGQVERRRRLMVLRLE